MGVVTMPPPIVNAVNTDTTTHNHPEQYAYAITHATRSGMTSEAYSDAGTHTKRCHRNRWLTVLVVLTILVIFLAGGSSFAASKYNNEDEVDDGENTATAGTPGKT